MPSPFFQLELASELNMAEGPSHRASIPAASSVVRLVNSDSPEVQSFLLDHKEALAEEFQKVLRASARLLKRTEKGEYGPITGIGVELHHKRGLLIIPIQYGLTVWVPVKIPDSQLRKRRSSSRRKGRVPGVADQKPLRLPRVFEKIPVKVMEGNAVPAIARQAYVAHAEARDLSPFHSPRTDSLAPEHPIGGSVISRYPLPRSASPGAPSQPPTESFDDSAAHPGPTDWGTLGIAIRDSNGLTLGFTCAHVIDSGKAYSTEPAPSSDQSVEPFIGEVYRSSYDPRMGVDVSAVRLGEDYVEGILDLQEEFRHLRYLVKPPARKSRWSWLIQRPVVLRGARTGRIVHAHIAMPTVHSIEIDGKRFQDLMVLQATSASSSIVAPGDSGAAVLVNWNSSWYWIGIVIAMLSPQQAVISKLPACFAACSLKASQFPKHRLWEFK